MFQLIHPLKKTTLACVACLCFYKYRLRFPIELAKVPFISSIIKKYLAF